MKQPKNRYFKLPKKYKVLDIGGGDHPHPRANVVVEKNPEDNTHRKWDMRLLKHQEVVYGNGEKLDFEDNSFDFVFCCHVLEHVDNPVQFLNEMFRVGKQGYLETPSLMGEYLAPKASHRWIIMVIDDKIVMFEKDKIGFRVQQDFGDFFLEYLPKNSIGWKILERTHPDILNTKVHWTDKMEVLINPIDNEKYLDIFKNPWSKETYNLFFPERTMTEELKDAIAAFFKIIKSVFKSKILKKDVYSRPESSSMSAQKN